MASGTVQEIERAIGTLTPGELEELYVWLDRNYPNPIDARIESDFSSGRLDAAVQRALEDEKNGRTRPI
jgi:hypothetical protein